MITQGAAESVNAGKLYRFSFRRTPPINPKFPESFVRQSRRGVYPPASYVTTNIMVHRVVLADRTGTDIVPPDSLRGGE